MIIGIDTWEGQIEVDEIVLKANDVQFVVPRLNSISGGHHKDDLFDKQWTEAAGFYRAPYFVYSPYKTGAENAAWLLANLPKEGVTRVFADIEVKKDDYPAATYAAEVEKFMAQVSKYYPIAIYTGMWFLGMLSYWPKCDYWWARYPYYLYPSSATFITWDGLRNRINYVGWNPDPSGKCPGDVKLWQCTADRYYLPGTNNRVMDINVANMNGDEFSKWWGAKPPLTISQRLSILEREAALRGWNLEL